MVTLLCRGKRTENNKWVEGYYVCTHDYLDNRQIHFIFCDDSTVYPHNEIAGTVEVDPKTIGRFTGLTDKNGVKIFEGDIVRSRITGEEFIVIWDELYSAFAIHNSKVRYGFPKCNAKTYQVVGNIHDNFDLLKGNE